MVNGKKIRNMDKEHITILMVINMKDNFKTIKSMDKVYMSFLMVLLLMFYLKKEKKLKNLIDIRIELKLIINYFI